MIKDIEKRFVELCKEFNEKNNFLYLTAESNKKQTVMKMEHNLFSLEFYYIKKESIHTPVSTLYCLVKLNKNSVVHYHLADILGYINAEDFRCMCYSYIESEQRMEVCFQALSNMIIEYIPEFEKLAMDDTTIRKALFNSYTQMYKLKENDLDFTKLESDIVTQNYFLHLQEYRDNLLVHHFTNMEAYHQFLLGDFEKSLKKYEKLSKKIYLLPYENNLMKFIKSKNNQNFTAINEECFSQKIGVKENKMSGVYFLCYGLLASVVFSLLFCPAFFVANLILSQGTELYLGIPWITGCIPACLCGLFSGLFFRNHITKLLIPKKSSEKITMDKVLTPKSVNTICFVAFVTCLCISIYSSVMMLGCNVRFYEDYFVYNRGEFAIEEVKADYEDVESVYFVEWWLTENGGKTENNNYAIGMKNKDVVYLDGWNQESVVEYLESKDCQVIIVESNEDLEKMGYLY